MTNVAPSIWQWNCCIATYIPIFHIIISSPMQMQEGWSQRRWRDLRIIQYLLLHASCLFVSRLQCFNSFISRSRIFRYIMCSLFDNQQCTCSKRKIVGLRNGTLVKSVGKIFETERWSKYSNSQRTIYTLNLFFSHFMHRCNICMKCNNNRISIETGGHFSTLMIFFYRFVVFPPNIGGRPPVPPMVKRKKCN